MIKLLIVTYDYPPVGGIGIQRVTKWVKYLPKFGIEPVVLTNEHGLGYVQDDSLLQLDFIKKTKVYRLGGRQLKKYHLLKKGGDLFSIHNILLLFRYIRGMDIFSSWFYEIKNELISIIEQEEIDCILTTSPPHSTHLFGDHIKTTHGFPWIMDLRDSMTEWPLRKNSTMTKFISTIESFYEKRFYSTSNKVVFATNFMKRHAQLRINNLEDDKALVIRNGFDPEDFESAGLETTKSEIFNITYTGTIHPSMDPKPFCNALINLSKNKIIPEKDIVIRVVGMVNEDKKDMLKTLKYFVPIEFIGHVTHREAIRFQLSADLLLLLMPYTKNEEGKEILTGKVFEYIGAGKPILALVSEGELADLIRENKLGYVADPGNQDEVEATLLTAYQNWKQGINIVSGENKKQFTRESQCETLSHIIKEVVG
jgi:glycosyltransferase involved in cell wall biosynthesis